MTEAARADGPHRGNDVLSGPDRAAGDAEVTAIIPTLCTSARAACLDRAIESLKNAASMPVKILVVINGDRFDGGAVAALRARGDVEVLQIAERGAPQAQRAGRYAVSTAYFCFLDDDDELLAGALDKRLDVLRRHPDAAIAVSRGWRVSPEGRRLMLAGLDRVVDDPLSSLFDENWLPSCAGLFRTRLVGKEFFDEPNALIEWTWLAFRLASAGLNVAVQPEPDFLINETPGSASKSETYLLAHTYLFERMLTVCERSDIRKTIKQRWVDAAHANSDYYFHKGLLSQAWFWHIASLRSWIGWRYLPYGARLLAMTVLSGFGRRASTHD